MTLKEENYKKMEQAKKTSVAKIKELQGKISAETASFLAAADEWDYYFSEPYARELNNEKKKLDSFINTTLQQIKEEHDYQKNKFRRLFLTLKPNRLANFLFVYKKHLAANKKKFEKIIEKKETVFQKGKEAQEKIFILKKQENELFFYNFWHFFLSKLEQMEKKLLSEIQRTEKQLPVDEIAAFAHTISLQEKRRICEAINWMLLYMLGVFEMKEKAITELSRTEETQEKKIDSTICRFFEENFRTFCYQREEGDKVFFILMKYIWTWRTEFRKPLALKDIARQQTYNNIEKSLLSFQEAEKVYFLTINKLDEFFSSTFKNIFDKTSCFFEETKKKKQPFIAFLEKEEGKKKEEQLIIIKTIQRGIVIIENSIIFTTNTVFTCVGAVALMCTTLLERCIRIFW